MCRKFMEKVLLMRSFSSKYQSLWRIIKQKNYSRILNYFFGLLEIFDIGRGISSCHATFMDQNALASCDSRPFNFQYYLAAVAHQAIKGSVHTCRFAGRKSGVACASQVGQILIKMGLLYLVCVRRHSKQVLPARRLIFLYALSLYRTPYYVCVCDVCVKVWALHY
jgi:hypothetical protein